MMEFLCPHCGHSLNIPEKYAGQTGTCRYCGGSIVAPQNARPVFETAENPTPLRQYQKEAPVGKTDIPNYLVTSILLTLFCCLPFGIVALVFAAQVNARAQAGDIQGALEMSAKARTWCWISFGCGLLPVLFYILYFIALGGFALFGAVSLL